MFDRLKAILLAPLLALYGVYVWLAFLVLGFLTLVIAVVPGLSLGFRRGLAHTIARLFLRFAGMPVSVHNAATLPEGPCVVVANHASYLDGVVLKAVLPARFCFVIKKEMVTLPLAGTLLRRIGSEFVDRFNRHSGGMDARRILKAAVGGQALVFFPEGTFAKEPGVSRFHTGAFAIAARSNLPVVPVAIRGTRRILPDGRKFPRPGAIDIRVLPAIESRSDVERHEWTSQLSELARTSLIHALGEPDLAHIDGVATRGERKS
jgi:1-acyl-sn-glycerol-3-phosphate acyltransferase